jgi:Zn-dependent peptidase ImmA (M78 family)
MTGFNNPELKAAELLEKVGIDRPAVPVDLIAEHLGLEIVRSDLGADVSGILVVDDGHGVIGVNESHVLVRQRFTIAHEIAHFVLHRDQLPVFIDTQQRQFAAAFRDADSATGEKRREVEANAFAAALLMPEIFLRQEIKTVAPDLEDDAVVAVLAERFKVSKTAMSFRLENVFGFSRVT